MLFLASWTPLSQEIGCPPIGVNSTEGKVVNEALAVLAVKVYTFLMPLSWIALVVCVLVLLPMALFERTRAQAGIGLFLASWLFGLTVWILSAMVTFATLGWIGLLIGLFIFGVGVVPIGIFAAFFVVKSLSLGFSMIVMVAIVWIARFVGVVLADR